MNLELCTVEAEYNCSSVYWLFIENSKMSFNSSTYFKVNKFVFISSNSILTIALVPVIVFALLVGGNLICEVIIMQYQHLTPCDFISGLV
jgi:hypothetical protein